MKPFWGTLSWKIFWLLLPLLFIIIIDRNCAFDNICYIDISILKLFNFNIVSFFWLLELTTITELPTLWLTKLIFCDGKEKSCSSRNTNHTTKPQLKVYLLFFFFSIFTFLTKIKNSLFLELQLFITATE